MRFDRASAVSIGAAIADGPLEVTVTDVLLGDEATEFVLDADARNDPVADGRTYVAARIRVANNAASPVYISEGDFFFVDSTGLARRRVGAFAPEPVINSMVEPGQAVEGWVIGGAAWPTGHIFVGFDPSVVTGVTSGGLCLVHGDPNTVASTIRLGSEPSTNGQTLAAAVGFDTVAATAHWRVAITDIALEQDVWDLYAESDRRVLNAGIGEASDADPWLAVHVSIECQAATDGLFSLHPGCFSVLESSGEPVENQLLMSSPLPEPYGHFFPNAATEGWVVFEVPRRVLDSERILLRFLGYPDLRDPRYFALPL